MDRSCGTPLREFGWLICLAGCAHFLSGCANYPLHAPVLRDESLAPAIAASGGSQNSAATSGQPDTASAGAAAAGAPTPLASAGRSPAAPVEPQDMPSVLAELETLGAIDAPTRERLVADLKKTDPALWPQLLSYFKASLAYRQKYGAGEATAQVSDSPAASAVPPPAVAARAIDEPALLPGLPSPKPPLAARPTTAAAATPLGPLSTATTRVATITDQAVQPATYDVAATTAEETAADAAAGSGPLASAATAGGASAPATSPASIPPVVNDPMPGATAPAVAQAAAASSGAPAGPLTTASPTTTLAPMAAVAASGAKPGSPAPAAPIDPLDWRGHLKAAIQGLQRETADPPATTSAISRHAGLRLLCLVDGDRDGVLRPLTGIPATQQDFWSQQLFGLSTYLDAERTPDDARRAAAAAVHLRDANLKLGDVATLTVRNLAFATEVHSYGVYKKFDRNEFHPGQEVLLYAEVENFKSAATDQGFHTALRSSYQILDNRGARVDQKEFEITEEHCQNPRRDYFIRYFVWMPKRIYGGTYTLQLTIEDTLSQKIGQASIEFTVADKE